MKRMLKARYFKLATVFCLAVQLLFLQPGSAEEIYKWTDENGTVNFSDSLGSVPQKYRNQFERRELKKQEQAPGEQPPKSSTKQADDSSTARKKETGPKRCEVPYEAYEGGARRVIVQVTFNDRVTAPLALDTGATGIVISRDLAERIGLFDKGESSAWGIIGGIGGRDISIRTILSSVKVGDFREEFIPTRIIRQQMSSAFEGLLGMDVMGEFSFTINKKKRVVEMEEDPSRKNLPAGRDEEWWRTSYQEFETYKEMWKERIDYFSDMIEKSSVMPASVEQYKKYRATCEWQYKEADNLLSRLDRYAAQNSVPVHWRRDRH